jgi:group I intron endonuclease
MEFINYTNKYDGGIYNIVNLINGKVYIGSTRNFDERFSNHLIELRINNHGNKHLQNSFNKYGEENFIFKIVKVLNTDNDIERTSLEQKFINEYLDKWNECFNIAKKTIQNFSKGGHKITKKREPMSEETKNKIRNTKLEYYQSDDGQRLIKRLAEEKEGKTYEEIYGEERAAEIKKDISEKKLIQMNQEHVKENLRQMHTGKTFKERFGAEKAKEIKVKQSIGRKGKAVGKDAPTYRIYENIKLQAPDGTIYTKIEGIVDFAKKHGLRYNSLSELFTGRLKSHRGWRLVD